MCLLLLGVLGAVVHGIVKSAANGSVRNNMLVGLRTPSTMASDEVWEAAHRSALPVTRVAAVAVPAAALVGVVLIVVTGREQVASGAALVCAGVLGVLTIVAGLRAHFAARSLLKGSRSS